MYGCCILREDNGYVQCWGWFTDPIANHSPPNNVAFDMVNVGYTHACGVRSADKKIECWGRHGVSPTGTYLMVQAGSMCTCAITTTNEVKCWNAFGQPPTGTNFDYVSLTENWQCARKISDKKLVCWGTIW